MSDEHDRLVPIYYFTKTMLGMKDRGWYYRHINDPGMPQRVPVGGKPMLSLKACEAYMEALKLKAAPTPPPAKRGRGRPRKVVMQPSA